MFGYNFSGIKYFGPPLVQFGARDCRTKQFFSWSIWPVFFRERRRAWGSLLFTFLWLVVWVQSLQRETPSQVSKPAQKPQVATNAGGEKIDSCVIIRLRCFSFLLIAIWVCGNQWWWSNDVTLMWPYWRKHTDATKFSFQPRGTVTHHNRRSRQKMTFMTGQINGCAVCVSHLIRSWIYDTWISWNGGFYTLHN